MKNLKRWTWHEWKCEWNKCILGMINSELKKNRYSKGTRILNFVVLIANGTKLFSGDWIIHLTESDFINILKKISTSLMLITTKLRRIVLKFM